GVTELLLGHPAIGDVRLGAGHPPHLAGRRADREASAEHPAVLAVLVEDAVLAVEVIDVAAEVGREALLEARAIAVVDAPEPLLRRARDLVLAEAEHRLPAARVE